MRHVSIEVLRAAAIFLMVMVHFAENLSGSTVSGWLPAGMAAPMFTLLSGVSFRLWLRSQEAKGVAEDTILKRAVRRGLFLFVLGFAFNILVWMPEDTFNWDILTFIGSATLFLTFARHQSPVVLGLVCVTAFVAHPFLRDSSGFASYWTTGYFDPDLTLTDVLLGYVANGYFPIFPWIIYPIVGFLAADIVLPEPGAELRSKRSLLILGATLAACGILALNFRTYASATVQTYLLQGWTMFPPSVEYVCWTLGFSILAFVLAHRWLDEGRRLAPDSRLAVFANTLSRHSLSVYLLHHVVHIWPLWIYGVATGHEATHFWKLAFADTISMPLAVVFVGLCYALFRWIDRRGWPTVETLMRWVCD